MEFSLSRRQFVQRSRETSVILIRKVRDTGTKFATCYQLLQPSSLKYGMNLTFTQFADLCVFGGLKSVVFLSRYQKKKVIKCTKPFEQC